MSDSKIEVNVQDNVATILFTEGDAFDIDNADTTKEALNQIATDEEAQHYAFDLGNVTLLPSSGIGAFVTLRESLTSSGRTMSLRNLDPNVLESFQFLHLDRVFDIEGDAQ